MAYNLIACDRNQQFLLPPSVDDWLPQGHLARFVVEVVDQLDLAAFYRRRREDGWGRAAYDPKMMVALLLYAYASGVRSAREIEKRCREDIAFRFITANECPDHATVARFRAEHAKLLEGLFIQGLRLCAEAGLVRVGLVALDSTRVKANAAMAASKTRKGIEDEVRKMLTEAAATDAREDAAVSEAYDDELPDNLRDPRSRLARLKEAKERIEREERDRRAAYEQHLRRREAKERDAGKPLKGRKPKPPDPLDKMQANVTDPDSRVMKTQHGFIQGYNAQAMVTENQIVIACDLSNDHNDNGQLHPMIEQAQTNVKAAGVSEKIAVLVADAGYYSEDNVTKDGEHIPELLIATTKDWKQRKAAQSSPPRGRIPKNLSTMQRMDRKLRTRRGQRLYRKRSQTVEPVFGQQDMRGLERLHRRRIGPARSEWIFENTAHNLLKLWRAGNHAASNRSFQDRDR